jgi:hypothetical protein
LGFHEIEERKIATRVDASAVFAGCAIMTKLWWQMIVMPVLLFTSLGRVQAQSLRDPTVPPVDARHGSGVVGAGSTIVQPGSMAIVVRNGKSFLVLGTRLYAQGEKFGPATIERITETEVWLREGGVVRKVPQFTGIQRRSVSSSVKPTCAPLVSKTSSVAASCLSIQP